MAKTDKLSTSRPIDDDNDLPDFSFDDIEPKDDRKPSTRIAHGALRGAKATITDTSFIKKMLRAVLPEGYGLAMDFTDEVGKSAKQLYNNAAKEIKPGLAEMSKAADKLAPASMPHLKSSLGAINKWADGQKAKSLSESDKEGLRAAGIGLSLAETFRFQMSEAAKTEARQENRERLQQGVEIARHRDVFGLLNRISASTHRLAQYQDKININYQRKSLETQMRTQFLMTDLVQETKAQNAFFRSSLSAIQKNTSLPDFVKLTESERLEGMLRSQIADKFMGGSFVKKMTDHLEKLAKSKIDMFKGAISTGATMMNDAADARDAVKSTGDAYGTGGEVASSVAVQELGKWLGKKGAATLGKNKNVAIGNAKLQDVILNMGAHFDRFKKGDSYKYDTGAKGKIASILRELIPDMGPETGVKKESMGDLNKPQIYTRQTHKTINEVIPGYLARIFRELQVLRTGDEKIGLTVYDPSKNKFLDSKTAAKNAIGRIIGKGDKESTTAQLDRMLNLIDPDKKIPAEARVALGKKLLADRLKGSHAGMTTMTDYSTYTNDKLTEKHADVLHGALTSHFGTGNKASPGYDLERLQKQNKFTAHQRDLGSNLEGARGKVQEMMQLGMSDFLQNAGILNADGDAIDIEKLLMYAGGMSEVDYTEEGVVPRTGNAKKIRQKKTAPPRRDLSSAINKQTANSPSPGFNPQEITKALVENSAKEEVVKSNAFLDRIEKLIGSGNTEQNVYFTNLMSALASMGQRSGGGEGAPASAPIKEPGNNKIFSNGNLNIGNFVKGVGKLGFWGANRVRTGMTAAKSTLFPILGTGINIASALTQNVGGRVLDRLAQVRDLYLPGMKEPVIKANMLKAGMYIDVTTGKVLKSLKDIKGQVKDTAGNVILEAKDVKDSFTKSIKDSGIIKIGLDLAGNLKDRISGAAGLIPPMLQMGMDMGKKILGMAVDLIDQPCDVYITGTKLPVLSGAVMRGGGYFLFGTDTVVDRPSKIKGPIQDANGDIVLTLDQLKAGIFDKTGKPIRTPLEKILNFGKDRLTTAKRTLRKVVRGAKRVAGGILGSAKGFLQHGLSGIGAGWNAGSGGGYGEESLDVLNRIYTILDERLPGSKKKIFGDTDGDGLRQGSWRSLTKKTGNHSGGVAGKATAAEKAIKKEDEGGGLISSLMDLVGDIFGGGKGGKGKGGLAKSGGKVLGALGSMGGLLGRGLIGAAGVGMTGLAGAASLAGSAIAGAGTLAVGALGALGAILTSPVVIGALAAGAVAYGGYKLYQYMTAKPSPLVSFRMVQYGFRQDDGGSVEKALKLEAMLRKNTSVKNGRAFISDKNFNMDEALAIFGASKDDEKALNSWTAWFTGRFKPVYLTHFTAIAATDNKTQLTDVDQLKPALKKHYLDLAHFPEGPYGLSNSPDIHADVKLTNAADVEAAFKVASDAVAKELKEAKDGKPKNAATAVLTGEAAVAKLQQKQAGAGTTNTKADGLGGAAVAASEAQNLTVLGAKPMYRKSGTVESLEGARFRTYGLIKMESEKVNGLRQLEDLILDNVKYNGAGQAYYASDTASVMEAVGMVFGVTANSQSGDRWMQWFKGRFLPVYLTYLGLIKQMTGGEQKKGRLPALKPSQELAVANQTSAVAGVWDVTDSPWEGFVLGTDSAVLRPILASLQDAAKNELAMEALRATTNTTLNQTNKPTVDDPAKTPPRMNNPSAYVAPKQGGVDAEGDVLGAKGGGGGNSGGGSNIGNLTMAGGAISDGRNAAQFMKLRPGVKLDGLNTAFRNNLNGMVEEYGKLTGKSTYINSGARSYEEQAALYKADPAKAAKPGGSLHEFGLAVDVNSQTLDEMEKLGLMRKYGFTRPVGGEPWHMEAAGIQTDISGFKADSAAATKAIIASLGRGGGGYGTMDSANKYGRDPVLAKKLLDATVQATDTAKKSAPEITDNSKALASLNKPATSSGPTMIDVTPVDKSKDKLAAMSPGGMASAVGMGGGVDAESKPNLTKASYTPGPTNSGDKMDAMRETTPGTSGKYSLLPEANSAKGWENQKDVILGAAKMTGVDPKLLTSVIAVESGFNPNAKSGNASGLGQFMPDTWKEQTGKHGSKYGLSDGVSPMDARANALMTGEYIKSNAKSLAGTKPDLNGTDLYLATFLGATGAKKFLAADPGAIAADILPVAAKANPNIFYSGNKPRTVGEVYALIDNKVKTKLTEHGVPADYFPKGGLGLKPGSGASLTGLKGSDTVTGSNTTPNESVVSPSPKPLDGSRAPGPTTNPSVPKPPRDIVSVMSPSADMTGINPRAIAQPQSNPNADMNSAMGDVSSTLKKSLDVQTQMLEALKGLLSKANQPAANQPEKQMVSNNDMKTDTSMPLPAGRAPNRLAPVSMART